MPYLSIYLPHSVAPFPLQFKIPLATNFQSIYTYIFSFIPISCSVVINLLSLIPLIACICPLWYIMLFGSLVAALSLRLAVEVVASPLLHNQSSKRDVPSSHSLHERHTPRMAHYWTKRERLPPKTVLPMRIGLKQQNLDAGHTRLMEMSVFHLDRISGYS